MTSLSGAAQAVFLLLSSTSKAIRRILSITCPALSKTTLVQNSTEIAQLAKTYPWPHRQATDRQGVALRSLLAILR